VFLLIDEATKKIFKSQNEPLFKFTTQRIPPCGWNSHISKNLDEEKILGKIEGVQQSKKEFTRSVVWN
jgi:hypothetical protein